MTGTDLLSKLTLSLNQFLGYNDQEIIDDIEVNEDLESAFEKLLNHNPASPFDTFINSLNTIKESNNDDFLDDEISINGSLYIIDFTKPTFKKKNRSFAFSNTNYSFFSSKVLFNNTFINLSLEDNGIIWKQIRDYLTLCYESSDNEKIEELLNTIKNQDISKGFIINKTADTFKPEKHYSYIYLSYLNNSKKINLTPDLIYNPTSLYPGLNFISSKNYEQYFDIYDVINELNQAPDILNRFLRLYHILEYLVYRVYLVDFVNRMGTNKIFIREFITASENMKKGEKDSFKKNFQKIFNDSDLQTSIKPEIDNILNQDITDFLSQKGIVRSFSTDNLQKISELIYGLRCSIVHNKESEYHLTISNYEDFIVIIPLIRKLLEIFEKLVIEKISTNHNNINYSKKTVRLY